MRLALVAALLCWTAAQVPPPPCPAQQPCSSHPLSCSPRDPFFSWINVATLSACHLTLEIRVGLTASMTGRLFRSATDTDGLVDTLRNMSKETGSVFIVDFGIEMSYCLSFCVMDDESSVSKAVDSYRVFSGINGTESSMDLLLGPSSWDFRMAAAQVAEEFSMPLLLWSFPESYGIGWVMPSNTMVRSTARWLGNLLTETPVPTDNAFGRLPPQLRSFNCDQLDLPEGYTLRMFPELLPCDGGPCNITRDLDYCAVKEQNLSIAGTWVPPTVLRNGGWYQDCLNIDVAKDQGGYVELELYFPRSQEAVEVLFTGANVDTGPYLFLDGILYVHSPGPLRLKHGTTLYIEYTDAAEISLSICLRQPCSHFQCPAGYFQWSNSSVCSSANCTEADLQTCCRNTTERNAIAANGPFYQYAFSSVLDLSVPPSHLMDQLLPMLLHPRTQFIKCVAQADAEDIYSNLCRNHIQQSMAVGFRTVEQPISIISDDRGVHHTIVHLMLMQPPPSVVLVCSDLETYSSFIHGLEANSITFRWVASCIPFGEQLQMRVQGSQLVYNYVEPTAWPTRNQLRRQDQVQTYEETLEVLPTQSFASLIKEQTTLTLQMLALRSGVQVLHQVAAQSLELFAQGIAAGESTDGIVYLVQALTKSFSFITYLGVLQFDVHGRRQIQRNEVGMRQFFPLEDLSELSDGQTVAVAETWYYNQARHLFSRFREFENWEAPLAPNEPNFLAKKMSLTYPCPPGCVVSSLRCAACPPGTFRQANSPSCSPCYQETFQDKWAGDRCFKCPNGGFCNSTHHPPIARPGFVRVVDVRFFETYADFLGQNACSTRDSGGLTLFRPTDTSRWDASKVQSPWILKKCVPEHICTGANRCAQFQTGQTCSSCTDRATKFEWWLFKLSCSECPPMGLLILQISVMVLIQVSCTLLLSIASRDSAWNEHSLAGPVIFGFLRALQIHAVLSKMMMESLIVEGDDWAIFVWLGTASQALFAPCLLPLASCVLPLLTESDLMLYHLFQFASRFGTLIISSTICFCFAGRGYRTDALVRTGYTALHFALPSLSFYSLALSQCAVVPETGESMLRLDLDIPCPSINNLATYYAVLHVLCMVAQWISIPWILQSWIERRTQDRYGLGLSKLAQGRHYWKILDDLTVSFVCLFAIQFGESGIVNCIFATEGLYALMAEMSQAYSVLCGNLMVTVRRRLAVNIIFLCAFALVTDFVLSFLKFFLRQDFSSESQILKSSVLILSELHMVLVALSALMENRVALVVNAHLMTAPARPWMRRISRLAACFSSYHSMHVEQQGRGGQVVFDARSTPKRHRKILMDGIASTMSYVLFNTRVLKMNMVRDFVTDAVKDILAARKAQAMRRMNAKGASRKIAKITQDEDEALTVFLQSDLIAPHELVCAIDDMTSGLLHHHFRRGQKEREVGIDDDEQEEHEKAVSTHDSAKRQKKAVAVKKKSQEKKNWQKKFVTAQVECSQTIGSLLAQAEDTRSRILNMWLIASENDNPVITSCLDKAEMYCTILQSLSDFLGASRDAKDPSVSLFLDDVAQRLRRVTKDPDAIRSEKKDKDPAASTNSTEFKAIEEVEAEEDKTLERELKSLFGNSEAGTQRAHLVAPMESSSHVDTRRGRTPRVALPFNSIDFQSRTQPAPSRYPELDWFDEPVNTMAVEDQN